MTNVSSVDDKKHQADKAWCFSYIYTIEDLGIIAVGLGIVCLTL